MRGAGSGEGAKSSSVLAELRQLMSKVSEPRNRGLSPLLRGTAHGTYR